MNIKVVLCLCLLSMLIVGIPISALSGVVDDLQDSYFSDFNQSFINDELIGYNVIFTSGDALGKSFLIIDNTNTEIYFNTFAESNLLDDTSFENSGGNSYPVEWYPSNTSYWVRNTASYPNLFVSGYQGNYALRLYGSSSVVYGTEAFQKTNLEGISYIDVYAYNALPGTSPLMLAFVVNKYGSGVNCLPAVTLSSSVGWNKYSIYIHPNARTNPAYLSIMVDSAPRDVYIDMIDVKTQTLSSMGISENDTYIIVKADMYVSPDYAYTLSTISCNDNSDGFSDGVDTYGIVWGDGSVSNGTYTYGQHIYHTYYTAGYYNVIYRLNHNGYDYFYTDTVEIITDETCDYGVSLSLSKTSSITPLSEYITMNAEIIGTPELIPGSSIGYYFGSGSGGTVSPTHVSTFTNTTNGSWLYNRNDLGITSYGFTTYDDILSEQIRFPDAGNYVVRFSVVPQGSCSKYVDKYVSVNPSSQVNLDIYFKDGITYNMIPSVTSAISIINVTGNTTYSGNPIGIATQIGQNVSIYATAEGYTPKHIYYTIPSSVYGNTLDIPFFMFPTDYGEYYPDNTTWTITVKSLTSGENLYGASVRASDHSGTIDDGYTNSDGYVTLFVPFRGSPVRLDVAKVPYISSSQWVNLGNATEYATTVYLNYGGTPTPTPSYNYTYTVTPTQTDTPIPTVTQITNPMLTVWVRDAITNLPIGDAYVYIYDGDEIDQTYKGSLIYSSTTDSVQGATNKFQMISNNAYWVVVSKSGYYTLEKRFRMSSQDASIFAPLQPSHGVTIATTQPTLILPTPGGTGIQGGFIGWILDYFSEWFGVDNGTARILLALFIIMCSAVFVGGSLAGFGSGAGAGMGALIGGMFAFIAMCFVQFLPFWLLPIGIAFVGMAFFVWNRQEK